MNPYKTPSEEVKTISKKEAIESSNKRKKKVILILILVLGVIVSVSSIDKDVHIVGSIIVGIFASLCAGIPLLFFYVFTKKR